MSTKCSIAYSNTQPHSFHFYQECFDEENVYLELEGVEFNATNNRVTVTIPVAIWEVIRGYESVDLSLANCSDAEISAIVEAKVTERITEYRSCDNEQTKRFIAISGSICYGSAELPRTEQINRGMQYYLEARERQIVIRNQILALKAMNET